MKSSNLGKIISSIEIHLSPFGLWLLVYDTEYFLPYKDYPWFQEAKVSDVYTVILSNQTHLYWPNLDIDLDLDIFKNTQKYPLTYY